MLIVRVSVECGLTSWENSRFGTATLLGLLWIMTELDRNLLCVVFDCQGDFELVFQSDELGQKGSRVELLLKLNR